MKLQIAHGVICGVNYLHTRTPVVVHGDLRVGNVLIGDGYIAKVTVVLLSYICDYGFLLIYRDYLFCDLWLREWCLIHWADCSHACAFDTEHCNLILAKALMLQNCIGM